MATDLISRVRGLVADGEVTKSGLARAAGLHANSLRDLDAPGWNPTAETLRKLEDWLAYGSDASPMATPEEIIDEARNGRMFILVDDEDRENEGDLVIPAQMATPAAINFMAMHGRGLICLALSKARCDALGLEAMSRSNGTVYETAFTVSIEAREGVTTGISAADRARTISVAIDASRQREDIVTPGHVFPLTARDGGVLVRAGHTEAAVDISRLAGLNPSGVICEIMNDDGTMARLPELQVFAQQHGLKIGTIADLIAYRSHNETLIECLGERGIMTPQGNFICLAFRDHSGGLHMALRKGSWSDDDEVLVRVHEPFTAMDLLDVGRSAHSWPLPTALEAVQAAPAGVVVLLNCGADIATLMPQVLPQQASRPPRPMQMDLRTYGVGAQILRELGVKRMKLLGSPRRMPSMAGYGLEVTSFQPADR